MSKSYIEMKREAELWVQRQVALEREQMRQRDEIVRMVERQDKLEHEQKRQAEQIAKHEKRIADLEFRMSQAESDIIFLSDRIAQLDAQRDYLMLQQSATVPGGREHTKYQTKIISIENQIHTAESKLNKAQYIKSMAQRELEVS